MSMKKKQYFTKMFILFAKINKIFKQQFINAVNLKKIKKLK